MFERSIDDHIDKESFSCLIRSTAPSKHVVSWIIFVDGNFHACLFLTTKMIIVLARYKL